MRILAVGVLGAALVACSKGDKPAATGSGSSAPESGAKAGIPSGPIPVSLPRVAASASRVVQTASAFVTVAKDGALALGKLTPDAASYVGTPPHGTGTIDDDLFAPARAVATGSGSGGSANPDEPTAVEPDLDAAANAPPAPPPPRSKRDARRQALEMAKQAGVLAQLKPGSVAIAGGGGGGGMVCTGIGAAAPPPRATFAVGFAEEIGALDVLVLADAGARATAALDVLGQLSRRRSGLAVEGKTAPGAIRFRFGPSQAEPPMPTVRITLTAKSAAIEALNVPRVEAPLEPGGADAKIATVVRAIPADKQGPVLVSLADETTVQQLVDVLAAVGAAGAPAITVEGASIGGGAELIGHGAGPQLKGFGVPRVVLGDAAATGELDKNIIRRFVRRNLARIQACYEKQLLAQPTLEGTVTLKFRIAADGKVASAEASGLDTKVASCVADVIESLAFPAPKGGGAVDVTYPFTFRPVP